MTDTYSPIQILLDRRSRRYRNLVVSLVAIGLATPLAAMVFFAAWRVLLGWLLVFPVVGFTLVLDARSVASWRSRLLDGWVAGKIDLDSLREGLASIKLLPADTIAGMVDPLPTRTRLGLAHDPSPTTREALAVTVQAIDVCSVREMVVGVVALTATVALLGLAIGFLSLWPLAGIPFTLVVGRINRGSGCVPPRSWLMLIQRLRTCGLDPTAFTELARKLDWSSLPERAAERWLGAAPT